MHTFVWFGVIVLMNCTFFALLQVAYFQLVKVQKLITTLTVLTIVGALLTALVCWAWWGELLGHPDRLLALVSGGTTYAGLSGIYILIGPASADRSLSAHITIHLVRTPHGRLAPSELLKRYDPQGIFQKRFRELEAVGVATREGGELQITAKGRRIAKMYLVLLKMLRLEENF